MIYIMPPTLLIQLWHDGVLFSIELKGNYVLNRKYKRKSYVPNKFGDRFQQKSVHLMSALKEKQRKEAE